MWEKLLPAVEPSLIYAIGTVGLALTYRYLRFPDFTVLGSIAVGGIAAIFFTPRIGPVWALVAASGIGTLLGLATGFLVAALRIRAVLAGIIVFTASNTVGMLFCGGTTENSLKPDLPALFTPAYDAGDVLLILGVLVGLILVLSFIMTTKAGSLLFAMSGSPQFVRFRHRYHGRTLLVTVALSNGIVGLAGGIHSLNDRGGNLYAHPDFLALALAGIFAADGLTKWAAGVINSYRTRPEKYQGQSSAIGRTLARIFVVERDDSARVALLFGGYAFGCVVFMLLSRAIYLQIFSDYLHITPSWQYLAIAFLMTVSTWWANTAEDSR